MLSKKLYTFIFKLFGSILDETFVLGVVDIFARVAKKVYKLILQFTAIYIATSF